MNQGKCTRNHLANFIYLPMIVLISFALLAGCSLFPEEEIEEIVPVIAPPATIQKPEYVVQRETIEKTVRASGNLMAKREEGLYFTDATLPIAEINVEVGQRVKQGDVLARLDTSDLAYEIKNSEFDLQLMELELIQKLREIDSSDHDLELERAKFQFEKQKLAHQRLLEKMDQAILRAPFDGEVIAVTKKVGDTVEAYKPVITVADLTDLSIKVSVSESNLKEIAIGMPARVRIAGVEEELTGEVVALPQEEENQGSAPKYITIDVGPLPEGLERGTPVDAQIITLRKENVLTIQSAVLRTYNGRHYVQVKDEQGRRDVDIEIGIQTPTKIEVISGLEEGQIVIGR